MAKLTPSFSNLSKKKQHETILIFNSSKLRLMMKNKIVYVQSDNSSKLYLKKHELFPRNTKVTHIPLKSFEVIDKQVYNLRLEEWRLKSKANILNASRHLPQGVDTTICNAMQMFYGCCAAD